MDSTLRANAEARLIEAAQALGLSDPRSPYRDRLRQLRQSHPDAFEKSVRHYEQHVLPALAQSEPMHVWLEYGRHLGSLTGDGRIVTIDAEGRAQEWQAGTPAGGTLALFLPDDNSTGVLVLYSPVAPSAAQQATIALLVDRKLRTESGSGSGGGSG